MKVRRSLFLMATELWVCVASWVHGNLGSSWRFPATFRPRAMVHACVVSYLGGWHSFYIASIPAIHRNRDRVGRGVARIGRVSLAFYVDGFL